MTKKILLASSLIVIVYLLTWPVPIDPIAWHSPPSPAYEGPYAVNHDLQNWNKIDVLQRHGPEDVAVDQEGNLYTGTETGDIIRLNTDGSNPEVIANTEGRPLGIAVLADKTLIVADAYRGLLSIDPEGDVKLLTNASDGVAFNFTNEVVVAANGSIYFTDSTYKFSAKALGNFPASLLDIYEHGANGRVLKYDPQTGTTTTLIEKLHFPNGIVLSSDQRYLIICETAEYRLLRHWLVGEKAGQTEPLIDALPGFPDNISVGLSGRYWFTLISPRSPLADVFSTLPFARKVGQRLPKFMQPAEEEYNHVIAIDENGQVLMSLQDPNASYPLVTSVIETQKYLYLGSVKANYMAQLVKPF